MNVRGLQRNVKNVVKNYTEAQVKVREATSNDPWGPSSTIMSEIADLTYNVVAFSEIMQMIWKRLNDHGKNWRHVYKALVLLEYLIKTGTEKVAQQCKENIFAIQTLKDFQYLEENKDQGMNVREKSKNLVTLLKDDEKLKNERARALKAKERFAQSISHMSNSPSTETLPKTSSSYHESLGAMAGGDPSARLASELENARPQTIGEEELQLQLALAMSKEEAETEDRVRKNDDLRLKLALTESENKIAKKTAMDDLLTINVSSTAQQNQAGDAWGNTLNGNQDSVKLSAPITMKTSSAPMSANDPWSSSPTNITPKNNDPWNKQETRSESANNDPWDSSPKPVTPVVADPWTAVANSNSPSDRKSPTSNSDILMSSGGSNMPRKTPESFLGPNSNLVNLDALISSKITPSVEGLPIGGNPFALAGTGTVTTTAATASSAAAALNNPFQNSKPPPPTINELRSQNQFPVESEAAVVGSHNNSLFGHSTSASLSSNSYTNNPFAS